MSAVEALKTQSIPKLAAAQAYLIGLISNRRRIQTQSGSLWLTVVKLPSADEFSMPGTVVIRSQSSIGDVGDKWSGVVRITGYARSFNSKADPETGEIKAIKSAENVLDLVES